MNFALVARRTLADAATALTGLLLLLAPSLWNGFPFVFFDTLGYVHLAFNLRFMPARSAFYGEFLRLTLLPTSAWLPVIAQSVLALWVLAECVRVLLPGATRRRFLALVLTLCVCTSLPWFAGLLIPDIFGPLLVLALYLLAFHADQLSWPRRAALAGVAVLSATSHSSFFTLLWGLTDCLLIARWAIPARLLAAGRPRVALPSLVLVLSIGSIVASNYALTQRLFLNHSGPVFLAARFMQDGLVKRLLDETCPGAGYRICAYKDSLPATANQWLWTRKSPFNRLGEFEGTRVESAQLVTEIVRRYPLQVLTTTARATASQLLHFRTGAGALEIGDGPKGMVELLSPVFQGSMPGQYADFLGARQQRGLLHFWQLNLLHYPVGALSLLAAAWLILRASRRRRWDEAVLPAFLLLALAGNAFICGAVSGMHERYQARMMPALTFAVLILLLRLRDDKARAA